MKIRYMMMLFALLLSSSCTDQLELIPPSNATTIVFYKSESDFLQAINSVYADLKSYPTRVLDLSETRSDNIYGVSDDGKRYWDEINNFSPGLAANSKVLSSWSDNYSGIFKANTLLDQLSKNGAEVLNEPLRLRLEAEGRFLRAFYYFDLVRSFGKVPLIDRVMTAVEAENTSQSKAEDIYALIIEDLKFASENLPEAYNANMVGHATRYAAKGILALVYMTRSGPSYGIEGPGLGTDEWSLAATLLDDIIKSEKFRLLDTYDEIFAYDNENNAEVIFDVQYISGGLGLGGEYPSLFLPDLYVQQIAGFAGGVMVRPPSADLLSTYPAEDNRKTFAVQEGYTVGGRYDARPLLVKYIDAAKRGTRWTDWPLNFIVLRYTDIVLLRAECTLNGASGSQEDVITFVNDVKRRANIPLVTAVDLDGLLAERRREFIGEGLRWHDLVRSGKAIDLLNRWSTIEDNEGAMNQMKADYIIYPIPQTELNINPDLYEQNEGYN
ncbi:RagB/SusD family nutrient uptake outer membrane protein [Sphingobacterium pedocola]|nr:RagB/SusD family nutrient uptake outer membrane protein [Sphingobacterium pedocola]